jgi:hypothetical protein
MRLLSLLLLAAACSSTDEAEPVDMRIDVPDAPANGLQWVTPDMVIPAFEEKLMCFFDTYEGPEVGVEEFNGYQSTGGHHVVVNGTTTSALDFADGELVDCTDSEMIDIDPLLVGGELGSDENDNKTTLVLPDGMGAKLKSGQRIIIQSHYLNYTDEPILVRDVAQFFTVEPDAVETWIAPFVHIQTEHPIQPGEEKTLSFSCTFEQDLNILFVGGHMHEYGSAFAVDWNKAEGVERVYDIPEWEAWMRDAPPYDEYQPGAFMVTAGDSFTTTCDWHNTSDAVVDFPSEMCATFGMAYSADTPMICTVEP